MKKLALSLLVLLGGAQAFGYGGDALPATLPQFSGKVFYVNDSVTESLQVMGDVVTRQTLRLGYEGSKCVMLTIGKRVGDRVEVQKAIVSGEGIFAGATSCAYDEDLKGYSLIVELNLKAMLGTPFGNVNLPAVQ